MVGESQVPEPMTRTEPPTGPGPSLVVKRKEGYNIRDGMFEKHGVFDKSCMLALYSLCPF